MKRERWDLVFQAGLIALVGWAVYESRSWDVRAHLFPRVVGIPLLGLLLLQVAMTVRSMVTAPAGHEGAHGELPADVVRRRLASIIGWMFGFAGLIWLIGFMLGGTLATLAYLKVVARERWPISLAITLGTFAFFVIMTVGLNIPFPCGLVPAPCDALVGGMSYTRNMLLQPGGS